MKPATIHENLLEYAAAFQATEQIFQINLVQESAANYDEPLIQFVDNILHDALNKSASDIHVEPLETQCRIRYRQDGILYAITDISNKLAARLITRLKVMAKLDITERRLPQDGRLQIQHAQTIVDVRINTCPTLFGEKIVLRILDSRNLSFTIEKLGLTSQQKNIFLNKLAAPQGLILVTGPTGSGKTMTLYSALQHLNTTTKNISTTEDPIEIHLPGVNQININPKIGFDFATALRTLLRQDPDIIMIGEIRDKETADIAFQAAETGHLVLTTLHTNNAIEAINRLRTMGVSSHTISHSLTLIMAQRLIRKLCNHCKLAYTPSTSICNNLEMTENITLYKAQGCQHCLNGYRDRTGVYELLPTTSKIINLITHSSLNDSLSHQFDSLGFINLRNMAIKTVIKGITSLDEINRVINE
jgi:type IV pilus assembly protein PilB